MNAYCIFCKTASEIRLARFINNYYNGVGITAMAPVRILKERKRGRINEVLKPILQGYIFLFSETRLMPSILNPFRDTIKLLCYHNGEYELKDKDLIYADFIYKNKGVIGVSDIILEGKEVKVISGPLKDFKGILVRFDKRKERVYLLTNIDGMEREISLSVNILDPM